MLANPTSPIRASIAQLSQSKSLIGNESRGPNPRKSAVVPTNSILTAANMPIIGGHHVLALQGSPEGWQATSLLERCREHADRQGARGAAACTVPGRDQRHAGVGVAALDRGARGRRYATADAVAVSGRSLRRSAGGRLDRPRQGVPVAIAPATTVGRVLAGVDAMARTAAGSVLVEAAGVESQRNALGSGPVRSGCLSLAGAGQRMAPAPRVVSTQCPGRSAGRGCRAGREPQGVSLS